MGREAILKRPFEDRSRTVCSAPFWPSFSLIQTGSVSRLPPPGRPCLSPPYLRILAGPGGALPRCCALRQKHFPPLRHCPATLLSPSLERPRRGSRFLAAACSRSCGLPSMTPQPVCSQGLASRPLHVEGEGCCGALLHHLGKEAGALAQARHDVDLWSADIERHGLERHSDHGVGLRHHDQGLWISAA